MHEISLKRLQQAEEHGKVSEQNGKLVEELGRKLKNSIFNAQQQSSLIEQCGRNTQKHYKNMPNLLNSKT
ncbi:MAG: hypothetical protein KME01_04725 [Chroococcus sp. CMT-3BRIN-NPC107]|jgi:hypothetical protein|nr:hypothetical protein [Chroococcus sp. CMT-3BRIN-NPC107]